MEIKTYFEDSDKIIESIKEFGNLQCSLREVDAEVSTSNFTVNSDDKQFGRHYTIDDLDIMDDSDSTIIVENTDYIEEDEDDYATGYSEEVITEETEALDEEDDDLETEALDEGDDDLETEDIGDVGEEDEDEEYAFETDIEGCSYRDTEGTQTEAEEYYDEDLDAEETEESFDNAEDFKIDTGDLDIECEENESVAEENAYDLKPTMECIDATEEIELDCNEYADEADTEEVHEWASSSAEQSTPVSISSQYAENTAPESNVSVDKEIELQDVPRDLVQFLRKYPKSEITFVLKYFNKREVDKYLLTGRVMKRGKKLFI